MRRWLPLAVGSGLLLAACTDSRGPTQPATRGTPNFLATQDQHGPRTHIMLPRGQARGHGGGSNTGIFFHGGPVILAQNVAAIYWGAAPVYNGGPTPGTNGLGSADGSLVGFFLSHLGGSGYYNINTTYFDATNTHISNVVNYNTFWADASNPGAAPSDQDIQNEVEAAINGPLGYNANTLYAVFTGPGVNLGGGFGTQYCAYHGFFVDVSGRNVKYAAMPYADDPAFPGACVALKGSPNNDVPADAEVNVLAHETEETNTDENLNAWFDNAGAENADKCAWNFGTTYTTGNGSAANENIGGRDWLIQMNWVNAVNRKNRPVGCAQHWP
jgi:phosphate-induced protein 1